MSSSSAQASQRVSVRTLLTVLEHARAGSYTPPVTGAVRVESHRAEPLSRCIALTDLLRPQQGSAVPLLQEPSSRTYHKAARAAGAE